jgi:hypothetical protein
MRVGLRKAYTKDARQMERECSIEDRLGPHACFECAATLLFHGNMVRRVGDADAKAGIVPCFPASKQ